MAKIVETEWSGYHRDKDVLRSEIWTKLKDKGVSPREPFGHIPSFVGVEQAADRLAGLPIWSRAQVIKSNPDTAHVALRLRALQDGKRLYMAVPRLTEERCFVELTATDILRQGISLEKVAGWSAQKRWSRLILFW